MAPTVIVFIDYQNMHMSGHRRWCGLGSPPEDCTIDPTKISDLIVSRRAPGGAIKQIRVYRGRADPRKQARLTAATDKQRMSWEDNDGRVKVTCRSLWYPQDFGAPTCHEAPREKGIDVALAVDMVRLAIEREYEVGILISRDTDMLPALETIVDLDAAHVETAGWEGTSRIRLQGAGVKLYNHYLSEDDFVAVRDTRSY